MKVLKESYLDISVEQLRNLLFVVRSQKMSVEQLRQKLFEVSNQKISAAKVLNTI